MPQAENALRQIQSLVSEESSSEEVFWLASYKGQGAVLKPFAAEGYTVFANERATRLLSTVGSCVILGFGLTALTISDDGWVRSSQSGKERFVATCSEWQKDAATKGYQWRRFVGLMAMKLLSLSMRLVA